MAKAVAKPKKIAAKSKPSAAGRAKPAPSAGARKALKNSPVKPAKKLVPAKAAAEPVKAGKWVFTFGDGKAEGAGRKGARSCRQADGQILRRFQKSASGVGALGWPRLDAWHDGYRAQS